MADNEYGLQLTLHEYDKFLGQVNHAEESIVKLEKQIITTANKLSSISFGNLKLDTTGLKDIAGLNLTGKSTAIGAIADKYAKLGENVNQRIATDVLAINKAISGGAQATTIEAKAEALSKIVPALKEIGKIKFGDTPTGISTVFNALRSAEGFNSKTIGDISGVINALVSSIGKLNKVQINKDLFPQVQSMLNVLNNLGDYSSAERIGFFAENLKKLADSLRQFVKSGKTENIMVKEMPTVFAAAADALDKFIETMKKLGSNSRAKEVAENMREVASVVRAMSKAFLEFKAPEKGFGDIDKNIETVINSLVKLRDAVRNFGGFTSRSLSQTVQVFADLGKAVSSLGNRTASFEKLEQNFENMMNAFKKVDVAALTALTAPLQQAVPVLTAMSQLSTTAAKSLKNMSVASQESANGMKTVAVVGATVKTSIDVVFKTINSLVDLLVKIAPHVYNLGKFLLALPFNATIAGFKLLYQAIRLPITILETLGTSARKFAAEMKLLKVGLDVLLAPFKALFSVMQTLFSYFEKLVTGIGKVINFFDKFKPKASQVNTEIEKFGKSTKTSASESEGLDKSLKNLTSSADSAGNEFRDLNSSVSGSIDGTTTGRFVQLSSSLQTISAITNVVSNAMRNIGQAIKSVASTGFEAARSVEDLTRTMNVLSAGEYMANSANGAVTLQEAMKATEEQTQALIDRYQVFAFQSPFSREHLTEAHQLGVSLGFTNDKAESIVKTMADWAAANGLSGESIKSLILPLGQMNSLTKANTVDLKQLITAGNVPAFEFLRRHLEETTGKMITMTDVQDALAAGSINSNTVINAMVKGMSAFEGSSATATESLSGLYNTFQDAKKNIILGFLQPLLSADDGIRGFAISLLNADKILEFSAKAKELGTVFAHNVRDAVENATRVINAFRAIFTMIPSEVKDVIGLFVKWAVTTAGLTVAIVAASAAISAIIASVSLFASPFVLATTAVSAFVAVIVTNFRVIQTSVAEVLWSISQLETIIKSVGKALQTGINFGDLEASVGAIRYILAGNGIDPKGLTGSIAKGITQGIVVIVNALQGTYKVIAGWFAQIGGLATDMYSYGVDTILSFGQGMQDGIGAIWNAISSIANIFVEWFQPHSPPKVAGQLDQWGFDTIDSWVQGMLSGIATLVPQIKGVLEPILAKTFDVFVAIGAFTFGTVINAIVLVSSTLTSLFGVIVSIGLAVVGEIALLFVNLKRVIAALIDPTLTFKERFIEVFNAIGDFLYGTFINVGFLLTNVIGNILNILGGFVAFINAEVVTAFMALEYAFPETFSVVNNAIIDFVNNATENFNTFASYTLDTFDSLLSDITEYGSGLVSAFADGILNAVDLVADALASLGSMISYWLEPHSPPKLLPDIDTWGTAAAQEYLDGFNKADFDLIEDFGDTIGKTLEKLDISDINVEEVTRAFATGLDNLNRGGEFGSDAMQRIVDLTGAAGPEIAGMISKYTVLAEEQSKLSQSTALYNEELLKAQSVLDGFNANESIDANQKKIDNLQNALNNNLLTQEERTNIQRNIEKLQAENRVKQLEQQKKKQEESVSAITESIDAQKELFDLSDKFDGSKQSKALKDIGNSAANSARQVADRTEELLLKQRLAGKTTEEQIAIYKEYLGTLEEGSDEYIKTQTKIIELEARLEKEREAAAKKGEKRSERLSKLFGDSTQEAELKLNNVADKVKETTERIQNNVKGMVNRIKDALLIFTNAFHRATTDDIAINLDFSTILSSAQTIGVVLGSVNKYIQIFIGWIDRFIIKNEIVRNALISLATVLTGIGIANYMYGIALSIGALITPINVAVVAIGLIVSAIATFVNQSGGFQGALDRIRDAWDRFVGVFRGTAATGIDAPLNFSTLEDSFGSIGSIFGNAVYTVKTAISTLYNNIKNLFLSLYGNITTAWTDTINKISARVSLAWTTFTGALLSVQTAFTSLKTELSQAFNGFTSIFRENWIEALSGLLSTIVGIFAGRWFLILKGISLTLSATTIPISGFTNLAGQIVGKINDELFTPIYNSFANNKTILGKIAGALKAFYTGLGNLIVQGFDTLVSNVGTSGLSDKISNFFANTFIGSKIEENVNDAVGVIAPSLEDSFDLSTFIVNLNARFQELISTISDKWNQFTSLFTTGPLANILNENIKAFSEFFSELFSSKVISSIISVSKLLGIVAGVLAVLASATVIGVLKNIVDLIVVIGTAAERVYTGITKIFSGDFSGIGDIFVGIIDLINGVLDTLAQTVADAILAFIGFFSPKWAEKLRPIVEVVTNIIAQFLGWEAVSIKVFAFFGRVFGRLVGWFRRAETGAASASKAVTTIADVVNPLRNAFNNFKKGLSAAWDALKGFGDTVPYLRDGLAKLNDIARILWKPFSFVAKYVKMAWDWFVKLFTSVNKSSSNTNVFTKVWESVSSVFSKVSTGIKNIVGPLVEFGKYIGGLIARFLRFVDSIVQFIAQTRVASAVIKWFNELFGALGGLFQIVAKIIGMVVIRVFNVVKAFFLAIKPIETVKFLFTALINLAKLLGTSIINIAAKTIAFGVAIKRNISDAINAILATEYGKQFVAWVKGWIETITNNSYVTEFYNWAAGWATALWDGLLSFVASIPTKIQELTNALAEWLEPHSPPKFLPDIMEWGKQIGLLLLQGIVGVPLSLLFGLGTKIGGYLIDFDYSTFASNISTKLSTMYTDAVAGIKKVATKVSDFITVEGDEEMLLAVEIREYLPDFDAIFGAGTKEKVAISIADLVTIDTSESTALTKNLNDLKETLTGFVKVKAIPNAFNKSVETITALFSGDITFPEALKSFYDILNSFINLQAIPEIFRTSLNTIIQLFSPENDVNSVAKAIIDTLVQFGNLVGIPDSVLNSISGIFNYLTGEDLNTEQISAVTSVFAKFDDLKGIPATVLTSIRTIFEYFTTNDTIASVVDSIATAFSKFNDLTGIGTGFQESIQSLFDFFTGESTLPTTITTISDALSNVVATLSQTFTNPFETLDFSTFETSISSIKDILSSIFESFTNLTTIDLSGIKDAFEPLTSLFDSVKAQIESIKSGLSIIPGVSLAGAEVENEESVQVEVAKALNKTLKDTSVDVETKINAVTDATNLDTQSAAVLTAFTESTAKNAEGTFYNNYAAVIDDLVSKGFETTDLLNLAKTVGAEVPAGLEEGLKSPEAFAALDRGQKSLITDLLTNVKSELGIQSPSTVARDELGLPIVQGIAEGLALTDGIDFTSSISGLLTTILTTVQTQLASATTSINVAQALFNLDATVVAVTTTSLITLSTLFADTFSDISSTIEDALDEWLDLFENMFETLLEMQDEFNQEFLQGFEELKNGVGDKLRALVAYIKTFTSAFREAGKALGTELAKGIKDGIDDGFDIVEAAIIGLANNLRGSVDIKNAMLAAGSEFGKPFADGIAEGLEQQVSGGGITNARLRNAIIALVNHIIDVARVQAGIHSPSRVAAALIGLPIAEGIGVGLVAGIDTVGESVGSLVTGLFNTVTPNIGKQFTNGIVTGIQSRQPLLNTAARELALSSVDAAKQALDINSPSNVTRNLIGLPYVQGIEGALRDGKSGVSKLASNLLTAMPNSSSFDFDISAMMNNDILKEQAVDVKYNGLLNVLPELTQGVILQRIGKQSIAPIAQSLTDTMSASLVKGIANNSNITYNSPMLANHFNSYRNMLRDNAAQYVVPHYEQKQQALQSTNVMHNNKQTIINNGGNEYHMHLTTTEDKATKRVKRNFDSIRYGYKL